MNLESNTARTQGSLPWPHAPTHWLLQSGIYMVTAATCNHARFFQSRDDLDCLTGHLLQGLGGAGWRLEAWAVFPNHYHFLARSPVDQENAKSLPRVLGKVHMQSAKALNDQENCPGRRVWHNYWDSLITYEKSYLARLRYVHRNPEHHGYRRPAETYRWCSASWFSENAPRSFVEVVQSFKTDRINVKEIELNLSDLTIEGTIGSHPRGS